ncbi:hypothetical protein V8F20_003463 [Naviculisporaceae sp. PSN 640]
MSGMEVAGVVLGVLPLAIKAVKQYMDILSSVKDAKRTLKYLLQDLETEQVRLETTCEVLLDGIVPHDAIDSLIRNPLGSEWKQYNEKLRLRLWTRAQRFEEQIAEMQAAVEELRRKLCIETDGTTKLGDRFAILRELKRGASFTLKKKDYDEIMNKMKTANSVLHDLVNQHRGLEISRKYRSQARLVRLVRNLARGIFNSLRSACVSCHCSSPHDVCLELEPRDVVIVPDDKENEVGQKFRFHVVLATEDSEDKRTDNSSLVRWESVDIKLSAGRQNPSGISSSTIEPSAEPQRRSRRVGWTKSLSFRAEREPWMARASFSSISTQTLVETTQRASVSSLQSTSAPKATGLCQLIKSPKGPEMECYGYIWDGIDRRFELRPPEGISATDGRTVITLRKVLSGLNGNPGLPPFGYPEKLRLALTLAVSVVHLYKTPWLPRIITLDDVYFLVEKDGKSKYHPFVSKRLREDVPAVRQATPSSSPRPVNLTVLSLGALLIQVMLGKAVEALDMAREVESLDMDIVLSKYEAGSQLSGEVLTCGGINFADVVKWCLGAVLEVAGFDNDEFCQKFYGAVVTKLEEDATLLVETS